MRLFYRSKFWIYPFIVLGIICINHPLYAGADYTRPVCTSLYKMIGEEVQVVTAAQRIDAQKLLNTKMSDKFPSLNFMLKNPDEFIATMEKRFEAQKKLTPNTPYQFDYTEMALPLFKKMDKGIIDRLSELKAIKEELKAEALKSPMLSKFSTLRKKYPEEELDTAIKYMEELQVDITKRLKNEKMTYQDTVELSFFYTNAVGHFDTREMSFLNRNLLKLDRHLEAHKARPIQDEYEAYKKRDFHLFQEDVTPGTKGYAAAEGPFTAAFSDKNKLQTIIVPNDDELDCDIFMRLMSREKINIVGVTARPIQADGFLRPSADFWVHDLRHESAKFHKKKMFLEKNKIKVENEQRVNDQLDHWYLELDTAVVNIKDPELKKAVDLLTFNFYHDRGYPIAPSTFLTADLNNVHFGLLGLLKVSKQGVDFKNPVKNLKAAEAWLKDYWLKKLPEEKSFLKEVAN